MVICPIYRVCNLLRTHDLIQKKWKMIIADRQIRRFTILLNFDDKRQVHTTHTHTLIDPTLISASLNTERVVHIGICAVHEFGVSNFPSNVKLFENYMCNSVMDFILAHEL